MIRFVLKKWLLVLFFHSIILLLLASCEERSAPAPVYELQWKPYNKNEKTYQVRSGDTLYSIAFRYDMDVNKLATYNNLKKPFNLNNGQQVRLKPGYKRATTRKRVSSNKSAIKHTVPVKRPIIKKTTPASLAKHSQWMWPVQGKHALLYTFNPGVGKKGIDIVGTKNMPVRASAPGVVAYAGNGLPGYGNLILLKHSGHYLTAYAHNQSLSVKEGQMIKAGQLIARMGKIDKKRWGLHFEIRKSGKPINPLNYLEKA